MFDIRVYRIEDVSDVKLTPERIAEMEPQLQYFKVDKDGKLTMNMLLENFQASLDMVNLIGHMAEDAQHHPDLYMHHYNKLQVTMFTYTSEGLSEKDFVMAYKIEQLADDFS